MLNKFESAEIFEKYAQIDLLYYQLKLIRDELATPKVPLVALVDKATGYEKARTLELTKASIEITEEIIKLKKEIEADPSGDEKMLINLKTIVIEDVPKEKNN